MTGRPWSRAQESDYPSYATAKAACENCISRAKALQYDQQLVWEPARTIVVLITDFYEGRDERDLVRQVRAMSDSGIRMIGLGALGYDARPAYNKSAASKLQYISLWKKKE